MSLTRLLQVLPVALLIGIGTVHAQVQEEWSHVYPGPGDNEEETVGVALDANGNCYTAGSSYGTTPGDFLVAKYNVSGGIEWHVPINGPGDSVDYATAMIVDAAGNCFIAGWTTAKSVAGQQMLLVKANTGGTVDWAHSHQIGLDGQVRALILDSSSNIVAVGMSNDGGYHAYVTKYSPGGDSLWTRFYKWIGASGGNGQRVACAPDGAIYFTGTTATATLDDILTVKLSADGDTLWGRVYDGPDHRYDEGRNLAVDDAGNAYVVGKVKDLNGNPDIAVLKYDPDGNLLWDWIYSGSSYAEPVGVKLDPDGNICIGGTTIQLGQSYDFTFIKLSADGDSLLFAHAGTSATEEAHDMALDASGNVYITGMRASAIGTLHDYLTMKFDGATGAYIWEKTWDGGGGYDRGIRICVGEEDHVYVAGYVDPTGEPDTKNDLGIVAYEPIIAAVFEPSMSEPPRGFSLHQNSPNPFNAATIIRFDLETGGAATLSIVNILGQTILTHREDDLSPGSYSFEWDGTDMRGAPVASGIYLYQMRAHRQLQTRKMVLLK